MSYPDYPDNRLIVNGVDLTEKYGIMLADGYTLAPPSPKTYTVNIPGGNGCIDLTESLLGDTAYENRKQEFTFYVINTENFETVKTAVSNFLHGKAYDYQITMDPGYTYHGRFSVTSYSHKAYSDGIVGTIKMEIDANPFKYAKNRIYKVNAVGGITAYFDSGRKRVRPVIETDNSLKVIYNGKLLTLPQGSWSINDLTFVNGVNSVYFNSYDIRNLKWSDLKTNNITWGDFKKKRLYEWYKSNGDGTYIVKSWDDVRLSTWSDLSNITWANCSYMSDVTKNIKDIYVAYEVGEL